MTMRNSQSTPDDGQDEMSLTTYLPEDTYFGRDTNLDRSRAVRVTAKYLSKWADSYSARLLHESGSLREGPLPEQAEARHKLVDELVDWLVKEAGPVLSFAALSLYKARQPVLDQHDGIPGPMVLMPHQFADLQDEWKKYSLPVNLYYPAKEQETVVEPTFVHGGVVLVKKHYSPMSWAIKTQSPAELMPVPDEQTRVARFNEARRQFTEAIFLRIMEIQEPGKEIDRKEIARLAKLIRAVNELGEFAD